MATGDEALYYVPRNRPLVLDLDENRTIKATSDRDWYFLSSAIFDGEGKNLFIEYDDRSNSTLFRAPLDGGEVKAVLTDGAHYSEFSFSANRRYAACIRQTFTLSPEIARVDLREGRAEVWTNLNPQFESIRLQGAEERNWRNRFAHETNGFLVLPAKPWKERHLPLPVIQYQFSNKFTTQAQWMTSYPLQHFVEAGFAVLLLNYPRELGWKPGDFEAAAKSQVYNPLASMETAVKSLIKEGIADPIRVGIMGGSFGAFLVEMAITQTDLFRAASAGEGGLNNAGQYWVTGSAGMQHYLDAFFGGPSFGDAYVNFRKIAPALNAEKMNVPLLREYGTDVGVQSLEFHMALRRLGKPVEQIIYPGRRTSSLSPPTAWLLWSATWTGSVSGCRATKTPPPRKKNGISAGEPCGRVSCGCSTREGHRADAGLIIESTPYSGFCWNSFSVDKGAKRQAPAGRPDHS